MTTKPTIDDLEADIGNLHQLLGLLYDQSTDLDFVRSDGGRNHVADRISAMVIIARDMAERMMVTAAACHT